MPLYCGSNVLGRNVRVRFCINTPCGALSVPITVVATFGRPRESVDSADMCELVEEFAQVRLKFANSLAVPVSDAECT